MKIMKKHVTNSLVLSSMLTLLISGLIATGMPGPKAGKKKSYPREQITIHQVENLDDGLVRLVFSPLPESMWYCPGVAVEETPQGLKVKFLRHFFKDKTKAAHPAKRIVEKVDGRPVAKRVVTFPGKGKRLLFDDGTPLTAKPPKDGK